MASSLIKYKRINTTVAKAKALRKYVEPLITKAKENSTNSRRVVFQYLQDKESIIELFGAVAEKVANRPGGYTRILKTGSRIGDNAEMCVMELVDYNELLLQESKPKAAKRSRRSKSKSPSSETAVVEEAEVLASEPEVKDETIEVADPKEEASDEEEAKKD
jgi:large subunit ribosomal protein L17